MEPGITRLTLEQWGGFAGPIARPPITLEVAALERSAREDLARLLAALDFFSLPHRYGPSLRPDALTCRLTVETADGEGHQVEFAEGSDAPPALAGLVHWLRGLG